MNHNPTKEKDKIELYDPLFRDSRFPIVERQLSLENQQRFKALSNEDKALFINILIKEGKLSW